MYMVHWILIIRWKSIMKKMSDECWIRIIVNVKNPWNKIWKQHIEQVTRVSEYTWQVRKGGEEWRRQRREVCCLVGECGDEWQVARAQRVQRGRGSGRDCWTRIGVGSCSVQPPVDSSLMSWIQSSRRFTCLHTTPSPFTKCSFSKLANSLLSGTYFLF